MALSPGSEVLREALLDAKKLREVAELEAKTSIVEALAPEIRRLILKELADADPGASGGDDPFLFPQDPAGPQKSPDEVSSPGGSGLPIQVKGGVDEGLGMGMPDADGRLVVDFDSLFVPVSPESLTAPSEMPGTVGAASAVDTGDLASTAPVDVAMPAPSGPAEGESGSATAVEPMTPPAPPMEVAPGGAGTTTPPLPAMPVDQPTDEENKTLEQTPMAALESWNRTHLKGIREAVDLAVAKGAPPGAVARESLRERIFKAYENLTEISGVLPQKAVSLSESRLDFLFRVLKEAESGAIYSPPGMKGNNKKMASLEEIQRMLFTEGDDGFNTPPTHTFKPGDADSTGSTGVETDEKKTSHAEKVSGIAPGVNLFEENLDQALQEMADRLVKEEAASLSTTAGANPSLTSAGKPFDKKAGTRLEDLPENTVLEIDEKELKEAIVALRKENLKKQLKSIREAVEEELKTKAPEKPWEDAQTPEGGEDPSHANLKEDMGDVFSGGGDSESGGMETAGGDDMGGGEMTSEEFDMPLDLALTLNIDNVDTLEIVADEDMLAGAGGGVTVGATGGAEDAASDELDVSVPDVSGGGGGGDDTDEDDASLELLDDEGEKSDDGAPSFLGGGDDTDDEEPKVEGCKGKMMGENAKKGPAVKPATKPTKQVATKPAGGETVGGLKKQLAEQALYTAKVIYLNKFLQKEGLSQKQRVKIATVLDKASTLAELKETYKKIKVVLEENAAKSKKSQEKVASSETAALVTESVSQASAVRDTGVSAEVAGMKFDFDRWMKVLNPTKADKRASSE